MPQNHAQGMLFHSDYKEQLLQHSTSTETLLSWQQYEIPESPLKVAPNDYPYKAPTSLFTVVRYLSEIFLQQLSQMTFFASTYYSSWSLILDSTKYSREHPEITRTCDLPLLNKDNIVELFKHLKIPDEWYSDCDISKWTGRPGLFSDYLVKDLLNNPPLNQDKFKSLYDKSLINAKQCVGGYLDDIKLNQIVNTINKYVD